MPSCPQVAQQINQEQNQQQNGPSLSSLHCSLPADCDKKHGILAPTPVLIQQVLDLHIPLHVALNSCFLCVVIAVASSAPLNSLPEY